MAFDKNLLMWCIIGIIVYIIFSYFIGAWEERVKAGVGSDDVFGMLSAKAQEGLIFFIRIALVLFPLVGYYYSTLSSEKGKYRISAERAYSEIPSAEIIANGLPFLSEVNSSGGFISKLYLPDYKAELIVPTPSGEKKVILNVASNCRDESRLLEVIDGEIRYSDYKWGRKYRKPIRPVYKVYRERNVVDNVLGGE